MASRNWMDDKNKRKEITLMTFKDTYESWHKPISFIKSLIRLIAAFGLPVAIFFGLNSMTAIVFFMIIFGLAEIFGILEEIGF